MGAALVILCGACEVILTIQSISKLKEHAEARLLLAACLCQPEIKWLREENIPGRLIEAISSLSPDFEPPKLDLGQGDELLVAYTRLFLGPGKIPAPPYGSVYLDNNSLVAGPSTLAVKNIYAEAGLKVEKDQSELPDHAAIELEFSAFLLDQALACKSSPEQKQILQCQADFEETYLRSWLPEFGRRIEAEKAHSFYDNLGQILITLPAVPALVSEIENSS